MVLKGIMRKEAYLLSTNSNALGERKQRNILITRNVGKLSANARVGDSVEYR